MSAADAVHPPALIHVDCDGLDVVQSCYGPAPPPNPHGDPLWMFGVPAALEIFTELEIRATFYLISRDLHHPAHRRLAEEVRDAGHEIASHSVNHRMTRRLTRDELRQELVQSREEIGEALGEAPLGYRAPGFALHPEHLDLIAAAGYRHDSSIFPSPWGAPLRWTRRWVGRRGVAEQEPYGSLGDGRRERFPHTVTAGGKALLELPVSLTPRLRLPAHASFALLRSGRAFERTLDWHADQGQPFVWLIHLIDLVDTTQLTLPRTLRASGPQKRTRLRAMLSEIGRRFTFERTDWHTLSVLEGNTQPVDAAGSP